MTNLETLKQLSDNSIIKDAIFKYDKADANALYEIMEDNNLITGSQRVADLREIAEDNSFEGDVNSAFEQNNYAEQLQVKLDEIGHEVLIDADDDTFITNGFILSLLED